MFIGLESWDTSSVCDSESSDWEVVIFVKTLTYLDLISQEFYVSLVFYSPDFLLESALNLMRFSLFFGLKPCNTLPVTLSRIDDKKT